ncbi:tRNA uridine-5-carboxymethylaminomethyl(34) synthesis GTPase MnmE [Flexibacterium corallicola]|uniref:tRNA uridine-5-carboxymethylaminomethyl(34) synthesis GTPase MnmE n=1 Tax=Flexibacterium corallicola TaxID=3037259 RepID=UPI00286F233A|nr:tRNA uridine-5-carboxymethylaminomethyl(34) synthesis GTPase MnmE [Pseudovibrio sp. M1P-2-3]
MSGMNSDTIYAVSSGALPSGVAVIRLSGPMSKEALRALTKGRFPAAREAALRKLYDPADGIILDEVLVLRFDGPNSFTGEDVVELHCHGGRAVVASILKALSGFKDCRPADQGEFTRRAFHNEKLDLTEVEGLADLIDAETEAQRRQAQRQMGGALGELYSNWRKTLIRCRALIEAELDFSDEEDVPDSVATEIWKELSSLNGEIASHLSDARRGERLRSGLQVILLGPPNAGKSSLMNKLAQRDVAIVTPEAGTTRDVLEVHLDLGGYPVTLIDTAGIREDAGLIEKEGIRRAMQHAGESDLILWTVDSDEALNAVPDEFRDQSNLWFLHTKSDLNKHAPTVEDNHSGKVIETSVIEAGGIDGLLKSLREFAEENIGLIESPLITRERYRVLLQKCFDDIQRAIEAVQLPIELRSEDLRSAADSLGRITGRIDVEDLLDVIFRDFCIGK